MNTHSNFNTHRPGTSATDTQLIGFRHPDQSLAEHRRQVWASKAKDIYDAVPGAIVDHNNGPDGLLLCAAYEGGDGKTYKRSARPTTEFGAFRKIGTDARVKWNWFYHLHLPDHETTLAVMQALAPRRDMCVVRGGTAPGIDPYDIHRRAFHATERVNAKPGGVIIDIPRKPVVIDVDSVPMPAGYGYEDVIALAAYYVEHVLPLPFRGKTCVVKLSSSAGLTSAETFSAHFIFRSTVAVKGSVLREILSKLPDIDPAVATSTLVIFTASPRNLGSHDPLGGRRLFIHRGSAGDTVEFGDLISTAKKQLSVPQRPPSERLGIVTDYIPDWIRIARNRLGDGPRRSGYNSPVYALVVSAIAHGEQDYERLKVILRDFVIEWAERLGDLPRRQPDLDRYLSDAELDRWITNAVNYVFQE